MRRVEPALLARAIATGVSAGVVIGAGLVTVGLCVEALSPLVGELWQV